MKQLSFPNLSLRLHMPNIGDSGAAPIWDGTYWLVIVRFAHNMNVFKIRDLVFKT